MIGQNPLRTWRPTQHYDRLLTEGRNRPAPSVGSPTLIWHLGIWRTRIQDEAQYGTTTTADHVDRFLDHDRRFFGEVSRFLRHLQDRGLVVGERPYDIRLDKIPVPGSRQDEDRFKRFEAFLPQSISFELWWLDGAGAEEPNSRLDPAKSPREVLEAATRVLVQFQSFHDHVTCTFYLDIAQKFDGSQILDADKLAECGTRKKRVGEILHAMRKSSLGQIRSGAIDAPERVATNDAAILAQYRVDPSELSGAVKYIYEDIWDDFQTAFGFALPDQGQEEFKTGVVFVNQRGVLISHQGLRTPADEIRQAEVAALAKLNEVAGWDLPAAAHKREWKPSARAADATLGPVDVFDKESCEAEAVLRSFAPFLEEMSPGGSHRDWVGCGILDWRGIFVSPLGSRAGAAQDEVGQALSKPTVSHWPERFLVLSKGEPNKQQIGRMIERITALETMRTFALRNLGLIQNSYHYLGVLTFALDNVLEFWNQRRKLLKAEFNMKRNYEALEGDTSGLKDFIREQIKEIEGRRGKFSREPDVVADDKERLYYELLSALNESIEKKLIEITADMERMGPKGSGHVLQDIQHATYHIDEFNRMVRTLEVGNLHGWINYEQFADRGMRPTFNMIQKAGDRLRGAQERIKTLTDIIQVSGLIVQSDATRRNTGVLRSIASDFRKLNGWRFVVPGALVAIAVVLGQILVKLPLGGLLGKYFN